MSKKILVINGPNLEMLGKRDKSTYGDFSLESLEKLIAEEANTLGCQVEFFQNNIEGEIINKLNGLDDSFDGIIINPGGLTHSSVSLHDSLEIKKIHKIEVHISNIYAREDFRQKSIIAHACHGSILGMGVNGYLVRPKADCKLLVFSLSLTKDQQKSHIFFKISCIFYYNYLN
jgi:3-dehydroquinate dehydratase-2